MLTLEEFDTGVRRICNEYYIRTGLDCRYIKTNNIETIKSLENLPNCFEKPIENFYAIGVIVDNIVVLMEVMITESDYMPDRKLRILLHRRLYKTLERTFVNGVNEELESSVIASSPYLKNDMNKVKKLITNKGLKS